MATWPWVTPSRLRRVIGMGAAVLMLASCGGETTPTQSRPDQGGANPPSDNPATVIPPTEIPPTDVGNSVTDVDCGETQVKDAFQRNRCLDCHSTNVYTAIGGGLDLSVSPLAPSLIDRPSAHEGEDCAADMIIDSSNPADSLLLTLTDPTAHAQLNSGSCQRVPMPQSGDFMSATDAACLADWVVDAAASVQPAVPAAPPPDFAPANAGAALAKAKYLLHGGAVTEQELAAVGGSRAPADPALLAEVVSTWEHTPQYRAKLEQFFTRALLQSLDPASDFNQQFNELRGSTNRLDMPRFADNLEQMMARTAFRIAAADQDFRQVLYTRDYEVTTAILLAMVYADAPQQTPNEPYQRVSADADKLRAFAHLTWADYSDWRRIRITQASQSYKYSNTAGLGWALRGLDDGDEISLLMPRVGFFSTPAFYDRWSTNDDNDFRITIQQTLIGALGAGFSPGDATPHGTEAAISADHTEPGTTCYQCHRHMDPMRLVFSNFQVSRNRAKLPDRELTPYFSFMGMEQAVSTPDEFGRALAAHPRFAPAWVQKLCYFGNAKPCLETDPEFERLSEVFVDSGFKFKTLVREFASSPLFTGGDFAESFSTEEFHVTFSRGNHLCQALQTRLDELGEKNGTHGSVTVCEDPETFGIVAPDQVTRGQIEWQQNPLPGLFDAKSLDVRCGQLTLATIANDDSRIIDTRAGVARALDQMVSGIMGLPANHHRFPDTRAALQDLFDTAREETGCVEVANVGNITCGVGIGDTHALRSAFFAACTAPDFIALGF